MTFSLSLLLYIYFGLLLLYALFILFNLYHMFKFSLNKFMGFFATTIFLFGVIFILVTSFYFIAGIDWSQEVTVFNSSNNNYLQSPYVQ